MSASDRAESQPPEAEHGKCKKPDVSLHVTDGRRRHGAMLYVMRDVALLIVCQPLRQRGVLLSALLLGAVACARTGLDPGDAEELGNAAQSGGSDSGGASGAATAGARTRPEPSSGAGTGGAATVVEPPPCTPTAEQCNGRDDDCNGAVDDLPAQACPGGGFRFCVAGRLSECPRRCEACVPGAVRVCQNSFCSFWGEQECAADGQGFGRCREAEPPPECAAVARKFQHSRELEQCCVDNGHCCVDEFDLDHDGSRGEMLGACGDIACQ